jgi:hypothetical protein
MLASHAADFSATPMPRHHLGRTLLLTNSSAGLERLIVYEPYSSNYEPPSISNLLKQMKNLFLSSTLTGCWRRIDAHIVRLQEGGRAGEWVWILRSMHDRIDQF